MKQILLLLLIAFISCQNLRNLDDFNFDTFYTALVNKHNTLRKKHNAASLKKLAAIATLAQKTANGCASAGSLIHTQDTYNKTSVGQNLYVCAGTAVTADKVEQSWYTNEEKNYDYDKGQTKGGTIGHFTQMVWKNTKYIGCAVARGAFSGFTNGYYLCCNYWPAGNLYGAYNKNVTIQTF